MKEFKGYDSGNEMRELKLKIIYQILESSNKAVPGSGDKLEDEILSNYDVVALSELSTSTLISIYENIMDNYGVSYGGRNKKDIATRPHGHDRDNE